MALDIRLDFISNIHPNYIEKMKTVRQMFIAIDDLLQICANDAQEQSLHAAARSIAIARSNNESACQNAIKSLCILGENK